MSFTIQQKPADVKACITFQTHAELTDIRLIGGEFSTTDTNDAQAGELTMNLSVAHEVFAEGEIARFIVGLTVAGTTSAESSDSNPVMKVHARFLLSYRLKPGYLPSPEELNAFKEANAVFNCWPYFREFLQSCEGRMGLRFSPLPLLRLSPLKAQKPDGGPEAQKQEN